jgi:hypothetical protein
MKKRSAENDVCLGELMGLAEKLKSELEAGGDSGLNPMIAFVGDWLVFCGVLCCFVCALYVCVLVLRCFYRLVVWSSSCLAAWMGRAVHA